MKTPCLKIFLAALHLSLAWDLRAQFNLDSLRRCVQTADSWQAKMDAQFQLAIGLHTTHVDSTLHYAQWFEKEAARRRYAKGMGMADELYAAYYLGQRAYDKSFEYYNRSVERYLAAGEKFRAAVALENMSYGLLLLHRYGEAGEKLYRALDIYTERKDSADISSTCVNLGRVLSSQKRFEEAEVFFRRAIAIDRRLGLSPHSAYNRLAGMFLQANRLDSAAHYYQRVLALAEQSGDTWRIMRTRVSVANLYVKTGELSRAADYYRAALAFFEQHNDRLTLPGIYISLADVENREGRHGAALALTQKARKLVSDPKNYRVLAGVYEQQAIAYEGLGNNAEALAQTKAWKIAADSLTVQENAVQVADITSRYRVREQEAVIAEQKLALEHEANRRNLLLFSVLLLMLSGGALLVYWRNRERLKKQRAELDLQLQRAEAEKLRELDKLKSDFFANISHELRTPLTLMQGPIDSVLKNKQLGERDTSLLRLAQQNAKNLLGLIGDILDLTKMESGKLGLEEEVIALYPLLNRLVTQFSSHAQRLGIQLTLDYRAARQLHILLDRKKWETLFNNLLSNAIKFTPAGGKVTVCLKDQQEHLLLSVQDSGRGIPPGDLERVFERFYRAAATEEGSVQTGGTGIGLALCREYATLFGGRIWAESPTPHANSASPGSVFYVVFPKKEVFGALESADKAEKQLAQSDHPPAVVPPTGLAVDVLIVEDNEGLQQYLSAVFCNDYRCAFAANGAEALQLLESGASQPNLILSDIMMPVMDGLQMLEKLKADARFSAIPVIMLTARADMQDKLHALRLGVDDYLLKPFLEEELLARVANLLHNARSRKQALQENPESTDAQGGGSASTADIQRWLSELEQAVETRLGDFTLNAETLADALAMSRAQFFRQVKKHSGLTPAQYLDEARFRRARLLLENGHIRSVKAAAYEVGFRDEKHFAKTFRERFGKYPSEYLAR